MANTSKTGWQRIKLRQLQHNKIGDNKTKKDCSLGSLSGSDTASKAKRLGQHDRSHLLSGLRKIPSCFCSPGAKNVSTTAKVRACIY